MQVRLGTPSHASCSCRLCPWRQAHANPCTPAAPASLKAVGHVRSQGSGACARCVPPCLRRFCKPCSMMIARGNDRGGGTSLCPSCVNVPPVPGPRPLAPVSLRPMCWRAGCPPFWLCCASCAPSQSAWWRWRTPPAAVQHSLCSSRWVGVVARVVRV